MEATWKSTLALKWGQGAAPLLEPSTTEETETVISVSDIHAPFQNVDLVDAAVRLIRKVKPHVVVVNGDLCDYFELSRFCVDTSRQDQVQSDIDEGNAIVSRIRKAAPNARLRFNLGNHDDRIITYVLKNAPALKSLRSLEPRSLFEWDKNEVEDFSGAGFRMRPGFIIKHGTIVRGEAGASAKGEHLASGVSGISGHTHRLATYRREGYEKREWHEQGALCQLDSDYIVGPPNWTNGCVIAQFSTSTDNFLVEHVQARDGKLVYGGKSY